MQTQDRIKGGNTKTGVRQGGTLTFKLSDEEREVIEQAAAREFRSVSSYVRAAALMRAQVIIDTIMREVAA